MYRSLTNFGIIKYQAAQRKCWWITEERYNYVIWLRCKSGSQQFLTSYVTKSKVSPLTKTLQAGFFSHSAHNICTPERSSDLFSTCETLLRPRLGTQTWNVSVDLDSYGRLETSVPLSSQCLQRIWLSRLV